ncbi:transposase [Streptomyces sp. NPDC057136]|uniref:IS110 family transposase n=1 Tax=Streptomyces sp. NPDC057136 TaxID=3346029 RepID=UPI003634E09B
MAAMWAGIDAGKTHHHCAAIDESGRRLLSRRVANDEPELFELLADVLALGDEVTLGIDLVDGGAALAIAILLNHEQPLQYISGRAIHRASEGYTPTPEQKRLSCPTPATMTPKSGARWRADQFLALATCLLRCRSQGAARADTRPGIRGAAGRLPHVC